MRLLNMQPDLKELEIHQRNWFERKVFHVKKTGLVMRVIKMGICFWLTLISGCLANAQQQHWKEARFVITLPWLLIIIQNFLSLVPCENQFSTKIFHLLSPPTRLNIPRRCCNLTLFCFATCMLAKYALLPLGVTTVLRKNVPCTFFSSYSQELVDFVKWLVHQVEGR